MTNKGCIGLGSAIAILSALWWNGEVTGRLGRVAPQDAFSCLWKLGSGDCGALWFVGLHQENQIAGLMFWFGVVLAGVGLWRNASETPTGRK